MPSNASPTDPLGPNYKPQFTISPEFRKFWSYLFKDEASDRELAEMTDTFVKNVWNEMNKVLKHALETMKRLEQERKEASGG